MDYKYKDGTIVKAGDVCFYSEDDGTNKWHYANGIYEIIELEDGLNSKAIFFTQDDGYTLKRITDDTPVHLKFCCGLDVTDGNTLDSFIKVGEITNPSFFDNHFINSNYARK